MSKMEFAAAVALGYVMYLFAKPIVSNATGLQV